MNCSKAFLDFLCNRVPHYDEAILKDIKPSVHAISEDVRLLPVPMRKIVRLHRFSGCSLRWVGRRLKIPYSTVRRRFRKGDEWLNARFLKWMDSLPKGRLKKEKSKRGDGWIGQVRTGKWDFSGKTDRVYSRFKIETYPDLRKGWISPQQPKK